MTINKPFEAREKLQLHRASGTTEAVIFLDYIYGIHATVRVVTTDIVENVLVTKLTRIPAYVPPVQNELLIGADTGQIIDLYARTIEHIKHAYIELANVESNILKTLGKPRGGECYQFETMSQSNPKSEMEDAVYRITSGFWAYVLKRLEIEKVMGTTRAEKTKKEYEYNKWSHERKPITPLTYETVMDIITLMRESAPLYARELAAEGLDVLTPGKNNNAYNKRATNEKNGKFGNVGNKVILFGMLDWYGSYDTCERGNSELLVIDKLFHVLDGKGIPDGYSCPLILAIKGSRSTEGAGETEYFSFKCYRGPHSLHLTFKRMDLVEKLNKLADEMSLEAVNL